MGATKTNTFPQLRISPHQIFPIKIYSHSNPTNNHIPHGNPRKYSNLLPDHLSIRFKFLPSNRGITCRWTDTQQYPGLITYTKSSNYASVLGIEIGRVIIDLVSEKLLTVRYSVLAKEGIREKFMNVISADITEIEGVGTMIRFTASFINIFVCFGVVVVYFGVWGMVGLVITLIHIPIILYALSFTRGYRTQKNKISDKRVKMIENLIQGIKIIKLYAWEIPYLKLIFDNKKKEGEIEEKIVSLVLIFLVLCQAGLGLVLFVSLTLHVSFDNELHSAEVFFLLSIYLFTQGYCLNIGVMGFKEFYSIRTSCKRIEELMLLKEHNASAITSENPEISLKNCNFSWAELISNNSNEESSGLSQSNPFQLKDISFDIGWKGLIVVLGLQALEKLLS